MPVLMSGCVQDDQLVWLEHAVHALYTAALYFVELPEFERQSHDALRTLGLIAELFDCFVQSAEGLPIREGHHGANLTV